MSRVREDRAAFRRPTNLSLDEQLVADAKALGINVSRACEVGLDAEIRAERNRRWKEENREATAAWAEYVETYGLPLERYRQF
ncbi:type II toxin-antitoxin system CcdA family antitoxin [Sphingomonas sp. PAMC 26605]|uniref:type II toxin-antitoxin system CcdA family antitoxin n=1 Tax=Sphingomonas sp. PAMC 26605 TaxID=1112214 RepID=UPI00026CCBAA|nr:type II toxin-antitoxin system CcdA family antitoxin [Sphingomonas sp. PAMC 26605]